MDRKSLVNKWERDADMKKLGASLRGDDKQAAPESYQTVFEKLSNRWGLYFLEDKLVIPERLRKKLLGTVHFGYAGTAKKIAEAKTF